MAAGSPNARKTPGGAIPPGADPRQHPRFDIRMSAEVRVGERTFTATTRNLSEGGLAIDGPGPLPEGAEVVLGLFLVVDGIEDDLPPLWVKGRIAWCAPADGAEDAHVTGIRFEVITPEQTAWLKRALAHIQTG